METIGFSYIEEHCNDYSLLVKDSQGLTREVIGVSKCFTKVKM